MDRTRQDVTYPRFMSVPDDPRVRPRRRRRLGLAALCAALAVVAVCAVCAVALLRPWGTVSEAAAPVAVAAEGDPLVVGAAPAALVLPDDARVLVFGDSWVYGSAAIAPTLGFAYRLADELGVETIVDGVRGSGYLKPGIDGPSYGERIKALDPALEPDVILLEGSINDRRLYPDGYQDAVAAAWDALAARYPDAAIVILGPAPQVLPVESATSAMDADLRELAAARGWWYVSPIGEEWITVANYLDVIDTSATGRDHPSTAGHAYLASRVAEAVRRLSEQPEVVADAPLDDEVIAP
jgi:lysophospholipase L1-like esterase